MLRLYRIKDWSTHFESHESRKYKRLDWVRMPNKHDGLGFRLLAQEKDAPALLAAWTLIVQVASKTGGPNERGALTRDNYPLNSVDMAAMTGFPAKIFDRAFSFFSQERIGWLVAEHAQSELLLPAGVPGDSPGVPEDSPGSHPLEKRREDKKREDKIRGEESTRGDSAAGAAPADDDSWLAELAADPAYRGIDVVTEHRKMLRWCLTKKRKPTRMRFINWLNRCDKPTGTEGNRALSKPPVSEPKGWKAFLNDEYPGSRFSKDQPDEAHKWSDLDDHTQRWLAGEMRKKGRL